MEAFFGFIGFVFFVILLIFWFLQYGHISAMRKNSDEMQKLMREQNELLKQLNSVL